MPENNETRELIESYLSSNSISYSELWFSVNFSGTVYHTANIIVNVSHIDTKRKTILLLAHYDSLSFDFRGRPYPKKAPGADDDLSGVMVLLYFLINMRKINSFGFSKNIIAVFLSGEENNYAGSQNILSFISNFTTIDAVIYVDEVGKEGSSLAIFHNGLFGLLESALRVKSTLLLPVKDINALRDTSFTGSGETIFLNHNISTLTLSELNYNNKDTHTEHDTLDKLSMDKIANATMFLSGIIIDYALNFPRNSSIVETWKHYFKGIGISIQDISSLKRSLEIDTLFLVDLPNTSILHHLRTLNVKKIVYLSKAAMLSSDVILGHKAVFIYDVKSNYTKPSLKYHPLLSNTSVNDLVFDFGIGFELGYGLDLLKFNNISLMKLTHNRANPVEIYFTPIKPANRLKKIFSNIVTWKTFDSYFYIVTDKNKIIAGNQLNISIYAKDPISWKPINTTAFLTVYTPLGDVVLSKNLIFSRGENINVSLYVKYPGVYLFQFEKNPSQEVVVQTLYVSPAVRYSIDYPEYTHQGDNILLNLSLLNLSNKTLSLTYFITNCKERTVNTGDFFLPLGETNMTLLSPEIWAWSNVTIEVRIESKQLFVALEHFTVLVTPGLSINVTSIDNLGQFETKNATISLISTFKDSGELLINVSGDFSASVSKRINSNSLQIAELPLTYHPKHPYDVGKKIAILSFYFNGHLVYRYTLDVNVVYSIWGFVLGFISPLFFLGLVGLLSIKRFTQPPHELVIENKWLSKVRKYSETIYLTRKEPAKKVLEMFTEKTAMKCKEGPFFTVYYNHTMIIVVKEHDTFYEIQCYSDSPSLVITTCLHLSIYAVPPRQ